VHPDQEGVAIRVVIHLLGPRLLSSNLRPSDHNVTQSIPAPGIEILQDGAIQHVEPGLPAPKVSPLLRQESLHEPWSVGCPGSLAYHYVGIEKVADVALFFQLRSTQAL
jgi:hypothetical protein